MRIDSLHQLAEKAAAAGVRLGEMVLQIEAKYSSRSPEELMAQMEEHLGTMRTAIEQGLYKPSRSVSGLSGGDAQRLQNQPPRLIGDVAHRAMAYALAIMEVNAAMGRIVAAPTAGSCGIVPGVILALSEDNAYSQRALCLALFTAAGVGQVIGQNATLSGAEGGCQAECGSAAAMAAAAAVELLGGTVQQALEASALALKNSLGLACDPVAGLVEIPCIKRNALTALKALGSAELALAGVASAIPIDQVIQAMAAIGHSLPHDLKETGRGGLAQTPRAKEIAKSLYGEL